MGAADPRVGSWTLTSAQSTEDPANKLSITSEQGTVHVVMTGEGHLDFTAKADGHGTPVPSNPAFDQVELHRIDKKQVEVREKKAGVPAATIRNKLSNDGNELTLTTTAKGKPDQVTVWSRSAGVKNPKDPFAGEWMQDLGKSRLRQGLTVKIDADGKFSGDDSYTAHFDGKQYDVRNSRNDTVQLALADPHTVDAVYRRDQQVTQKDRWAVSADGRTMTLTSTATLETGQHITEKLVFQKQ
jgi:hypothetical protein